MSGYNGGCGCGYNSNYQVSLSDRFKYCSSNNSDERTDSFSSLLSLFSDSFTSDFVSEYSTIKETPSDGDTIILPATSGNIRLLVKPSTTLATLTIKLPQATGDAAVAKDKQRISIFFTEAVTALSFDLNGASAALGLNLTSPAQNESFTLMYDSADTTWYEQR